MHLDPEKIKALADARGWPQQKDICEGTGIPSWVMSSIMRGKQRGKSKKYLEALSEGLGCKPEEIQTDREIPAPVPIRRYKPRVKKVKPDPVVEVTLAPRPVSEMEYRKEDFPANTPDWAMFVWTHHLKSITMPATSVDVVRLAYKFIKTFWPEEIGPL
jgi:hypothetical protein